MRALVFKNQFRMNALVFYSKKIIRFHLYKKNLFILKYEFKIFLCAKLLTLELCRAYAKKALYGLKIPGSIKKIVIAV